MTSDEKDVGNLSGNMTPDVLNSPLFRKAIDTLSGFNSSLAEKVMTYRNDSKRYKALLQEQKSLLRDSEAFIESVFLDGKWEKRLICSALGRIIGGIRDGTLDRVTMVRQAALIVNLVHNSIDNPVLYTLSDNEEKDFIQSRPIETINAILQGKYETIELMQGYHRLMHQYQRLKQQQFNLLSSKSKKDASILREDEKNFNLNESPIKLLFGNDHPDITLEKLMRLLDIDELHQGLNESKDEMKMAPIPNTTVIPIQSNIQPSNGSSNSSNSNSNSNVNVELEKLNKELTEEINRLKNEKSDAIKDIIALREYAAELQTHLETTKKTYNDTIYDLRLSNELLRLRELEATTRLQESQTVLESKDELIKTLENKLLELTTKYEILSQNSISREQELRKITSEKDHERISLVESLAQVTLHLNDTKREYSHYKSITDANIFDLKNQVDKLTIDNNQLGMDMVLLNQKLALSNGNTIKSHGSGVGGIISNTDNSNNNNSNNSNLLPGTPTELSAQIKKLMATLGESEDSRHNLEYDKKTLQAKVIELEEIIDNMRGEMDTMEVFHNMKINTLQSTLSETQTELEKTQEMHRSVSEELQSLKSLVPSNNNISDSHSSDPVTPQRSQNGNIAISPVPISSAPMLLEGDSLMTDGFAFMEDSKPVDMKVLKQYLQQVRLSAKTTANMLTVSNREMSVAKKKLAVLSEKLSLVQSQALQLQQENNLLKKKLGSG